MLQLAIWLQSRYLVLNPIEYRNRASMLIELFGCRHSEPAVNPDVTNVTASIEVCYKDLHCP